MVTTEEDPRRELEPDTQQGGKKKKSRIASEEMGPDTIILRQEKTISQASRGRGVHFI